MIRMEFNVQTPFGFERASCKAANDLNAFQLSSCASMPERETELTLVRVSIDLKCGNDGARPRGPMRPHGDPIKSRATDGSYSRQ
jgi:hypothetical protein